MRGAGQRANGTGIENPGQFRRHLEFYRMVPTGQNSIGENVLEEQLIASAYGRCEGLSGIEMEDSSQVWSEEQLRITCRYFDGLLPSDRLLVDGSEVDMQSVLDKSGSRLYWTIVARVVR